MQDLILVGFHIHLDKHNNFQVDTYCNLSMSTTYVYQCLIYEVQCTTTILLINKLEPTRLKRVLVYQPKPQSHQKHEQCTEAVTPLSTDVAYCCLTSVNRQILIVLCHNSRKSRDKKKHEKSDPQKHESCIYYCNNPSPVGHYAELLLNVQFDTTKAKTGLALNCKHKMHCSSILGLHYNNISHYKSTIVISQATNLVQYNNISPVLEICIRKDSKAH